MSAESDLEKTEDPSATRLDKAREEGDVPHSRELVTTATLFMFAFFLSLISSPLINTLKQIMASSLNFGRAEVINPDQMLLSLAQQTGRLSLTLGSLFLAMVLAIVTASCALGGFNPLLTRLMPNFGRMNFFSGLKRMISLDVWIELGKAIGKALIVGLVAFYVCLALFPRLLAISNMPIVQASFELGVNLTQTFIQISFGLVLIALLDVPYQLYQHKSKLRMSKQDLKDEYKQQDQSPELKSRIRQQQRDIASGKMWAEIPHANVVLTNPTHYAVALKYSENEMGAPRVVAKGIDQIALSIQQVARNSDVTVLAAPKLTRALYTHTEIGNEIPPALYVAVAEILAFVMSLPAQRAAGNSNRTPPTDLNVPDELDPSSQKPASESAT